MAVAIIGMAGYFPEANDVTGLCENLRAGRDSVRAWSRERLLGTSVPTGYEYAVSAYLEDVDKFDYPFFSLSPAEAQSMDPRQRLLLEVAYQAFENAGYNPRHFDGSNTAVFVGDTRLDYYELAEAFDPTLMTGNLNSATAGRIARFFNLRGMSAMIDTACSSSLVAVHLACNELNSGASDHALVGGINLSLFPVFNNPRFGIGVIAPEGKAKTFSAAADGTGRGEVIAALLLKPYAKAVADRDNILAVIRGTAANQDAALSGSFTAPSSKAQSEVIRQAWKNAGIAPRTVTCIEAHGTGTRLGDPIEVQGIDLAFREHTAEKHFCAISSLKTNIGHTDSAAGVAGLVKAVLSVKHRQLFPSLHFDAPNPLIDFENSAVYVNTTLRDWDPGAAGVRRAGVSAFSLSGTNCHVLVEEPPQPEAPARRADASYLFPVSARTPTALAANVARLKQHLLDNPGWHPADVSYTLATGREHFEHRVAVVASSPEALLAALTVAGAAAPLPAPKDTPKTVFIFPGHLPGAKALATALGSACPAFGEALNECLAAAPGGEGTDGFYTVVFGYCFYRLLEASGLESKSLVGEGAGKIAVALITGKTTLREGLREASQSSGAAPPATLAEKAALLLKSFRDESVVYAHVGPPGPLAAALAALSGEGAAPAVVCLDEQPGAAGAFTAYVKELYLRRAAIDWSRFSVPDGRRIELPGYQFDKKRCWLREINETPAYNHPAGEEAGAGPAGDPGGPQAAPAAPAGWVQKPEWTPTENKVAGLWTEVLKLEGIGLEDDFFDLGGHSLNGMQVINRINQAYNLEVDFEVLFDYATPRALAAYLDGLTAPARQANGGITPREVQPDYELSHAQKRLWILGQYEKGSSAYNISGAYLLEGPVYGDILNEAFGTVVARHESLRTVFVPVDGAPRQQIRPAGACGFAVNYSDLSALLHPERAAREVVEKKAAQQFDLAGGPLIDVALLKLGEDRHVLFLALHHIIADGWSLEVLVREVVLLYNVYRRGEPNPLLPLPVQYKDYVAWQSRLLQGDSLEKMRTFWLDQFRNGAPALHLPADHPRPPQGTHRGERADLRLDARLSARLREVSARRDCTLYMTLLTSLNALLFAYTGQDDLVVGTPVAGRVQEVLEGQIGMYLNTLALRTRFSPDDSFAGLLEKVKRTTLGALAHQQYPFDSLVEELNLAYSPGRNPLFDVGFTFNTVNAVRTLLAEEAGEPGTLNIRGFDYGHGSAKVDLWFHVNESGQEIRFFIDYSTDLFKAQTIRRLTDDFLYLLEQVVATPGVSMRELARAVAAHRQQRERTLQSGTRQKNQALLKQIAGQQR